MAAMKTNGVLDPSTSLGRIAPEKNCTFAALGFILIRQALCVALSLPVRSLTQ